MTNDSAIFGVFGFVFLAMIGGSIWGAIVLALKWASGVVPRIVLGLALCVVLITAGTPAIIAGCVAVAGGMGSR